MSLLCYNKINYGGIMRKKKGIIFGIKTPTSDKIKIIEIINQKCEEYDRTDFHFYQAYYSKETGNINYKKLNLNL